MSACPFERGKDAPGRVCYACAGPLPKRAQRWCSKACSDGYWRNHGWSFARDAALARDGHKCVRCGLGYPPRPELPDRALIDPWRSGISDEERAAARAASDAHTRALIDWDRERMRIRLEVNHISPRHGRGYGNGCWNHLENLETLCRACHQAETNRQREERKDSDVPVRRFWIAQWRPVEAWANPRHGYRHVLRRKQEVFLTLAEAIDDATRLDKVRTGPYYDRYPGETRYAPILLRVDEIEQRGASVYSLVQRRTGLEMPFDRPEAFAILERA